MALETGNRETYNRQTRDLLPVGLLDPMTLAGLMHDQSPALLLAADGRTPLWSSDEAARRFGYGDALRLMRGRLPDTAPGTRRLAEIGASGDASGGMPKLERLRYFVGFRGVVLTVLCRTIRLGDGSHGILVSFPEGDLSTEAIEQGANADYRAVVVAPDEPIRAPRTDDVSTPRPVEPADPRADRVPAANLIREARASLDAGFAPDMVPADEDATATGQQAQDASIEPGMEAGIEARNEQQAAAPEPEDAKAASASASSPDAIANEFDWLHLPADQRTMRRFVFALSPEGVLKQIGAPLAEIVGAGTLPRTGSVLADSVAAFDQPAADAIRTAIDAGETFSGISVDWPVDGQDIRVPVVLSALPRIDASGGLAGFNGFGHVRLADARRDDGSSAFERPVMPPMDVAEPDPDIGIPEEAAFEADVPVGSDDDVQPDDANDASLNTGLAGEESSDDDQADLPFDQEAADPDAPATLAEITGDIDEAGLDAAGNDTEAEADEAESAGDPLTAPAESAADDAMRRLVASAGKDDADEKSSPGDMSPTPSRVSPFPLPGGRRAGDPPGAHNVVSILNGQPSPAMPGFQRQGLSMSEKNAFREIAKALGARLEDDAGEEGLAPKRSAELAADPASVENRLPVSVDNAASAPTPLTPMPDSAAAEVAVLDRLPVGLLVLKGDEPLFVNRTLLDLTAYPDFATFISEGGPRAIFRKGVAPREENATPDPMVLASRDGTMIPVEAHLQMINWRGARATMIAIRRAVELEQGKALRTVAFDLKRARNEAQELRAILDTATDGVLTLDENGHLLSMNGAAEALFGISQNEVVGEHVTRLIANDSHAVVTDYIDGMRANGVRSVLNDGREILGREKKGGRMPLFMTLGRINEDMPLRFCAVLRDLTAWKRAEAELTDARRTAEIASAKKSDFLAKISHEIRTPMNAIIGFSEVMQEERLGPIGTPKYKEYLADIRTSGQHVVSLVNDLLDLAKIEAGRMELDFQATDLNGIVGSAVAIIQPQANTNRVLVRSQLATKLPLVVADERSVRQIVLNILSNATRFTEPGGQVIVSTSLLDGGEAVIRIRDTGIGMSPAEIEQALEPFRQVGTRRDKGGTGLGLPLTKALVEANRANFAIRSHPGEGTMVEITFPATRVLAE